MSVFQLHRGRSLPSPREALAGSLRETGELTDTLRNTLEKGSAGILSAVSGISLDMLGTLSRSKRLPETSSHFGEAADFLHLAWNADNRFDNAGASCRGVSVGSIGGMKASRTFCGWADRAR